MCGIAGIIALTEKGRERFNLLPPALSTLSRRGPDASGSIVEGNACLGHTRLAIIDLTEGGAQPMKDISGRFSITFNGEIYNYQEQRQFLQSKGFQFKSDSDTEVLLNLFAFAGKDLFERLNGFFAFAVHDKESGEVLIARDRMGIKPLYYFVDEDALLFSSELKTLMAMNIPRELNPEAVSLYFQLGYVPSPLAIFNGVKKLPPGHFLQIRGSAVNLNAYYTVPFPDESNYVNDDYETAARKVHDLVNDSVKLRMVSDVPLGAFLSGGIDSSVVVACASKMTDKLSTFSIGYKDHPYFDETVYANLVAKKFKTDHTVFSLTNNDLFGQLHAVLEYIDEPFADSSAIAVNILSMHTRKKVTVALSGDGGDELFGGYNKHHAEWMARYGGMKASLVKLLSPMLSFVPQSRSSSLLNKIRQLKRFGDGARLTDAERYWKWATLASLEDVRRLTGKSYSQLQWNELRERWLKVFDGSRDLNKVMYADMLLVLPNDMLYKVDMMSMQHSLEVRVPLLDYRIVDYVFRLPSSFKVDRNRKKKLLIDAFADELPPELLNRPKRGFEVPMLQWLRTDLQPLLQELTSNELIRDQGLFDPDEVNLLRKKLFSPNPGDIHFRLWSLIVFQYWWKNHLKSA